MKFTDELKNEYEALFNSCVVNPKRSEEVEHAIDAIMRGKERYAAVGAQLGMPWWFVGILHFEECGSRFDCHLHNGNSILHATTDEPQGRPPHWPPHPFPANAWEISAIDALTWERECANWQQITPEVWASWEIAPVLYRAELWNGIGYRFRHVNDPYLWGASNHQQPGRFIADHVFSPTAVTKEVGAATLLKSMLDQNIILALRAAEMAGQ